MTPGLHRRSHEFLATAAPDQKTFAVENEQGADSSSAAVIAANSDAYIGPLRDVSHPRELGPVV